MGMGQRVARKGPFTFPITGGKRPGAGAGGGICGRADEDAGSVMMFLFGFTLLTHSPLHPDEWH
jgi:hypothetical protein